MLQWAWRYLHRPSSLHQGEVMTRPETKSPPWLRALNPSRYAASWFEETGFAEEVEATIAKIKAKPDQDDFRPVMLAALKDLLKHGRALAETAFRKTNDGALYLGGSALIHDTLIRALFINVTQQQESDLALVATGGYGRGELAPASDIDLLFLTPKQVEKDITHQIETMLYILWDMGLTVGHATRSLRQAIKAAKEDITIRTALIEARYLSGNRELFDTLIEKFDQDIVTGTASDFIIGKLDERDQRHARSGNRRYVVEPNIKDGKGGLRDLQTLFWIARYVYKVSSIEMMIERKILSRNEVRVFSYAQRFLWAVRCHLHLRAGREDDRLTFDAQLEVAPLLGFSDRAGLRGVERFMRRYYLAAKSVGNLTRIFCAAFAADFDTKPRNFLLRFRPRQAPKPFEVDAGRLTLPDSFRFRDDPLLMMRMFETAQASGRDIHSDTLRKLHGHLNLVDADFRSNPEANAMFLNILTSRESPERVLRLMNESGFIGKFVPDFGRIVAMMQFDMYHSYTVDEHTIYAMGILSGIEHGELAEIAPVATAAIKEVTLRKELYVALLLHDIAKGRGGDHSILGAEVARHVCPRFGLTEEETETVAWLVRFHLLMSETAFRYDLNDPMTITNFAAEVQSPERLNLLLVLTVADIRAVGPNVWNGWKAALMRDLYSRTMAHLRGENPDDTLKYLEGEAKAFLAETLSSCWTEDEISHHLNMFTTAYWTGFDGDSHNRHAEMCQSHISEQKLLTILMTSDLKRKATEVVIITPDDAGLFSRIAGGLAAAGANIVDARITTRKDGLTLDVFWIQDQHKEAITDPQQQEMIRKSVEEALTGMLDIGLAMDRRHLQTPARIRRITAPARVLLNNNASKNHTVIEINGKDAPGLLYKVTRKIADMGLQIQTASVSTYGDRVVDVFYVKDGFGLKITSETRLQAIQQALLEVLKTSDPANQVAA
jgi:[protein-PII] uridylyltransferase